MRGYFGPNFQFTAAPDLAATRPTWNTTLGGVDFGYTINGTDLSQPTTTALFWSADTTFDPSQDTLIPGSVTATQTAARTDPYSIHVDAATLGSPPAGARYLLAVVDPPDAAHPQGQIVESDETNNVQSLALPAYLVWNTNDSGTGSLRQAILNANAHSGTDTITFLIGSGVQTIIPASPLPTITDPVVIDGTTQPGFSGSPLIEINGANAGTDTVGLTITAGNTTIKDLVINRFGLSAIHIYSGGGDVMQGDYIGTDTTGTLARPNGWGQTLAVNDAIVISSANNTIGGLTAASRNVISGNAIDGVLVFGGSSNQIIGNFIGTDVSGTHDLGNAYSGIRIEGTNNVIGGSLAGAGNVIAGNKQFGVLVTNSSPGTVIQGNRIGTDVTGSVAIGNAGYGVLLATSVYNEMVGGTAAGAGNVIAYNGSTGVFIGQTDQGLPLPGTGNAVLGNSIFANGGLGIDLGRSLGPDGPNPNDASDTDTGPNGLQNYPVLASAVAGPSGTVVQGSLNSSPNTTFRIEVFTGAVMDPSGYGEGQKYLGFLSATTDSQGNATFSTTLPAVPAGQYLSATATDPNGNTSEFSHGINVLASMTYSLWSGAVTPQVADAADGNSVELGVRFTSSVSGTITGLKFYKGPLNTGAHVADLWSATGALLATATFTNETASGWQQVNLSQPVAVTAGTTYVASYHTNVGEYAADKNYFAAAYSSGPLQVPANGGVYSYGPAGSFPRNSYAASNYWVDLVLAPGTMAAVSGLVQPSAIGLASAGHAGTAVPGAVGYGVSTDTATLTPSSNASASTTDTATRRGAQEMTASAIDALDLGSRPVPAAGTASGLSASAIGALDFGSDETTGPAAGGSPSASDRVVRIRWRR